MKYKISGIGEPYLGEEIERWVEEGGVKVALMGNLFRKPLHIYIWIE